jgi:hypothetical protein
LLREPLPEAATGGTARGAAGGAARTGDGTAAQGVLPPQTLQRDWSGPRVQ